MSTPAVRALPRWSLDVVVGLLVLALGLVEIADVTSGSSATLLAGVVVGTGAAAGLARVAPAVAVGLTWAMGLAQITTGTPVLFVQVAAVLVLFGAARWGRSATVVAAGLTGPLAAAAIVVARSELLQVVVDSEASYQVVRAAQLFGGPTVISVGLLVAAPLVLAWVGGLAFRFAARAQRSERSELTARADSEQARRDARYAREIAVLREDQARLARDVHDVVGHSLAVILAQAESAAYLADDPDRLQQSVATIATLARTSLREVREVLASTAPPTSRDVGRLVEGVRASGREVVVDDAGTPGALPPGADTAAFHVVQEMLTNAVRHGRPDRPIRIERRWLDGVGHRELRVSVANAADPAGTPAEGNGDGRGGGDGRGVDGMRERLAAVGGSLETRYDDGGFVATAWIPLS